MYKADGLSARHSSPSPVLRNCRSCFSSLAAGYRRCYLRFCSAVTIAILDRPRLTAAHQLLQEALAHIKSEARAMLTANLLSSVLLEPGLQRFLLNWSFAFHLQSAPWPCVYTGGAHRLINGKDFFPMPSGEEPGSPPAPQSPPRHNLQLLACAPNEWLTASVF